MAWAIQRPAGPNRMKIVILTLVLVVFSYSLVNFFLLGERAAAFRDRFLGEDVDGGYKVGQNTSHEHESVLLGEVNEEEGPSPAKQKPQKDEDDDAKWFSKLTSLNPFPKGSPTTPAETTSNDAVILPDRHSLGEMCRIAKVSILFDHPPPIYLAALRTHEAHDRLHNYYIHLLREPILDSVWTKPAYMLSLLLQELAKPASQRLEWLFWIDADTIVLNHKVPLELFLPPDEQEFSSVHMLVTHDWNGLNNGVFPIRVTAWAVELFAAIVAFRSFRPQADLPFRDQTAMDLVLRERRFARHVVRVPQRWFNAYQGEHNETLAPHQVRRGDLLVHFPGEGDRDGRMRYWLDRSEEQSLEWEVDVKHTSYPSEVRAFWDQQRRDRRTMREELAERKVELRKGYQMAQALVAEHGHAVDKETSERIDGLVGRARELLDMEWELQQDLSDALDLLGKLADATRPLSEASSDEKTSVVKEAHEMIFDAEHIAVRYSSDTSLSAEIEEVKAKVLALKNEVTDPDSRPKQIKSLMAQLKAAKDLLTQKAAEIGKDTVSKSLNEEKAND